MATGAWLLLTNGWPHMRSTSLVSNRHRIMYTQNLICLSMLLHTCICCKSYVCIYLYSSMVNLCTCHEAVLSVAGTAESTFSFRIREDRQFMSFSYESTFNNLCGPDKDENDPGRAGTVHVHAGIYC